MMSGQRRILLMQVLLISLAFLATAAVQEEAIASSFGRYHAVVIGNQNYKHLQKLETPLADAQEVAEILKDQYGFEVTLLPDATREEIMRTLIQLRNAFNRQDDNLLIYYAGHGYLNPSNNVGYWQPIDAEKESELYWISSSDLTDFLRGLQAKHILVIADSCFAGSMLTRDSGAVLDYGSEVWLRRMRDKKSRNAFTSGGEEPVIDTGGGSHSIFAKVLIEVLKNNSNILDGRRLFDIVKQRVVNNASQTPRYEPIHMTGHEDGDFIFVPKGVKTLPIVETTRNTGQEGLRSGATPRIDEDKHDWERLSNKGTEGLKSYLLLHSNGKWADEARDRIARLQPKPQRPVVTLTKAEQDRLESEWQREQHANRTVSKEQQAQALYEWQKDVSYSSSSETVKNFLQRFPVGSHVPDAERKLSELRALGQ